MSLRFSYLLAAVSTAYATRTLRRYTRHKIGAESPRRGGLCITSAGSASPLPASPSRPGSRGRRYSPARSDCTCVSSRTERSSSNTRSAASAAPRASFVEPSARSASASQSRESASSRRAPSAPKPLQARVSGTRARDASPRAIAARPSTTSRSLNPPLRRRGSVSRATSPSQRGVAPLCCTSFAASRMPPTACRHWRSSTHPEPGRSVGFRGLHVSRPTGGRPTRRSDGSQREARTNR